MLRASPAFGVSSPDPKPKPRIGQCPRCGARTRLDDSNAWRPFCSRRCKLVDLDGWFEGRYFIAGEPDPESAWRADDSDDFSQPGQ